MQTQTTSEETKARIAALRQGYARLKALCGPNGVAKETIETYKKEIQNLEAQQLKGGEEKWQAQE